MLHGRASLSSIAVVLLGIAVAGCGPSLSTRVPDEAIARLPVERRLSLLDAETDLLAAVDRRDAQADRVLASEEAIVAAGRRLEEAEERLDRKDASREVGKAAVDEGEARVEVARRDLALEQARLDRDEVLLLVARARFEQVRAREVKDAGLAAAFDLEESAFSDQLEELASAVAKREKKEASRRTKADEARVKWTAAREKLAALTGGAAGTVWTP